jgi:polyisoprenoid-binding protein YceI
VRNLAPAVALVVFSLTASAQDLAVHFDPAKCSIKWTLAGNVHTVHGTFQLKNGQLESNLTTGTISGDLVVDAASGESGDGARDRRMHKDILQSAQYKEIRFTPQKLEGSLAPAGHSRIRVRGAFWIHGGTHELSIPMDVTFSGNTVEGTGKFSIPYVDWGMKDPSNFLFKVDKSVEVEIEAVGTIAGK